MTYEYSTGRYSVHVSPLLPGPALEIVTRGGTTAVPADETPALALAVLTEPYSLGSLPDREDRDIVEARRALQRYADRRAEAQAREQEDVKVAKFRRIIDGRGDLGPITDRDRHQYRGAREFFEADRG